MAGKDYYLILGVARSESAAGIRARYRDLVRTLHPDVAGAESTAAFRAVTEAYEILADPAARRRHNTELAAGEWRPSSIDSVSTPVAPWSAEPVSVLAASRAVRPSFEALVERLVRNFTGIGVPQAERPEGLTFEVILTPDEALRGVEVPLGVPGLHRCPECGGGGRVWLFQCVSCGETGVVASERVIRVPVPAGVRSGAVIERSLDQLGIQNLYLRLCVRIE
jgi:hypothetical protein